METTLRYPDKELIVMCRKENDCYVISKEQLPNGVLPNGSEVMYRDNVLYKVCKCSKNNILTITLGVILIIVGIILIVYFLTTTSQILNDSELKSIMNELIF